MGEIPALLIRLIVLDQKFRNIARTGNALTFEEFENMSKLELAQMVLNSASCNGLKDFNNMLLGGMNHPEEEGEDE